MNKHPEIVLGEYLAADSPGEWLMDEVGEYLFGNATDDDRDESTDRIFEQIDDDRRAYITTQLNPEQLVQFSLEVEKAGRSLRASFSEAPAPVVLLDMCLRISDPGDEITISHTYAGGGTVVFEGAWPFGMDWAVRATAPMGKSFSGDEIDEIEELEEMVFHNVSSARDDEDDDEDNYATASGQYSRLTQRFPVLFDQDATARRQWASVASGAASALAVCAALWTRRRR
jgi:hypothetical protein